MKEFDNVYNEMKKVGADNIEKYIENYESDNTTVEMLLFIAYDIYKYNPTKQLMEQKLKRQFQKKFRSQLEKRYEQCVISGDDLEMCEACHIVPFCESDYTQMYDVNNGLLLTGSLHKLFDKYLLSINESGKIVLSKEILLKQSYKNYHKYNGLQLKLNKETLKNVQIHYDKYMEVNKE
jgi:predicted restriction endonuclease